MVARYSIVRYVPDTARGEFVNVGVLVERDDERALRRVGNLRRARYIGDPRTADVATQYMDWLEDQTGEPYPPLDRPSSERAGLIQLSAPAPIAGDNVEELAERLATTFLVEPQTRSYGETRSTARSRLRHAMRESLPDESLDEGVILTVGDTQRMGIDFAVRNGVVRQLSHAWSFRTADLATVETNVRAWAWVIDVLRDDGGSLKVGKETVHVLSDVDVEVFCIPPIQDSDGVYEAANATFDRLEVPVREDVATIAGRASELLAGH